MSQTLQVVFKQVVKKVMNVWIMLNALLLNVTVMIAMDTGVALKIVEEELVLKCTV